MGTALIIALVAAAVLAAAGGVMGVVGYEQASQNNKEATDYSLEQFIRNWMAENGITLSEEQIKALVDEYSDDRDFMLKPETWGDTSDPNGLAARLEYLKNAYDQLGEIPDALTAEDLARIQEEAYNEIDAENQRLLDLYNQSFANSETQLQNALLENSAMFGDYRNQVLTNEAMRQQAIAGSVRFELDRQQRNAITRGASAAQRLVAGINSQLGLQAQSAQQALDTSNALAQNLLAHRQAQQGVRNDYLTLQNQHNRDIASILAGQAERRYNYGQERKQGSIRDNEYARNTWYDDRSEYFKGDSLLENAYGYGRRNKNNGL